MDQSCGKPLLPVKDEVDRVKRRSLLPKPGSSRYSTRLQTASSLTEQSAEAAKVSGTAIDPASSVEVDSCVIAQQKSGRLRPRSMYQSSTASARQTDSSAKPTSQRSIRPPASMSQQSEPTATTSSLTRSQSLRRPGSTSSAPHTGIAHSHSRTQSTSTLATSNKDPEKTTLALTDRPKSLLAAPSSHVRSSVKANAVPNAGRMSNRLAGLTRSVSTKATPDVSNTGTVSNLTSQVDETLSRTRKREAVPGAPKVLNRPAFSTLQQHFTPRKTGKAPTAAFLQPTTVTSPHSLPAEVVSLQSELLQLHLLHQSAEEISQQWEQSARRSLHAKFEAAVSLHKAMLEHERAEREQENLQALLEWGSGVASKGVMEHIQALSVPLHDLPSLIAPGGRFQRHVSDFEQWTRRLRELRLARNGAVGGDEISGTIEGLGESWQSESMALKRKLTSFARDLDTLSQPSSGSSMSSIVGSCKSLLRGMLDELQIMQEIEAYIVDTEKDWVDSQLDHVARNVETAVLDMDVHKSAWQD